MTDDTIQKRLLDQLASAAGVDILGVVSPRGISGSRSGTEELWKLSLEFEAWKMPGGNLQTGSLHMSRKVTQEELDNLREVIAPYTVIHIKGRLGESPFGGHQALLEEFIGIDASDAELNHYAEQLQKPVILVDSTFGTLTLDRRVDWFTAEAIWNGKSISLHLSESAKVQEDLRTAHSLWQNQVAWHRQVCDYAVQKLLPLKNNYWLDEDETDLTPDEFKARMQLESITVNPDSSFDFWHNDGGLFFGHSILISGSLLEGLTHADIPG